MDADRRRHRRYVLQIEIVVLSGSRRVAGRLLDLSEGGAFVAAPVDAEVGAGAFVHFVHGGAVCEATGQVVRTLPFGGQVGLAVEFAFANDALGKFLDRWAATAEALRPDLLAELSDVSVRLP